MSTTDTTRQLQSVECIGIEKRGFIPNRYHVYVLIVEWNNGEKYPIYRKYSSFYDFERMLKDQTGSIDIPELPTMNVLQKAFGIERNHVNDINEFCQGILTLPSDIVNSHVLSAFFDVWCSDFPLVDDSTEERMLGKKRECKRRIVDGKNTKTASYTQETVTNGPLPSAPPYEEILDPRPGLGSIPSMDDDLTAQVYVCTSDYVPDSSDELSLQEGMKCIVLERNDDGWWFIMRENDEHQGYAPGSFLSPEGHRKSDTIESAYSEIPSHNNNINHDEDDKRQPIMKVRALSTSKARDQDEMSYAEGDEFDVLDTDNSGWWTVRCHGKVGLVPAVHLEPSSTSRTSEVFMRNNSLYTRKPPPRRRSNSSKRSADLEPSPLIHDEDQPNKDKPPERGYITVPDFTATRPISDNMASKRIIPAVGKSRSEGITNYAELVFDDNSDKPKVLKPVSNNLLRVDNAQKKKDAADAIIYTEIIPKNLRKTAEAVEDLSLSGKKPERGKAVKKVPHGKIEEANAQINIACPSPTSVSRVDPPLPVKPRIARPQEPRNNYENQSVPSQPCNGDAHHNGGNTYMNMNTFSSGTQFTQHSNDPDYLRRSSVEPPPAPTTEAPRPSSHGRLHASDGPSSLESYSPMISKVQATALYDGPPISGMLMFTKGDIATLISKNNAGWWYVNLKGLEGYVPGAYWEVYHNTPSPRTSPLSRRKAPQPVPRTLSPPHSLQEKNPIEDEAWYHGKLSRPESEKMLANFTNGVFLIRESVNRVGDLTLSVRWESKVRHFPIEAKDGGLYNIGKHDFKTLHAVINHYSKHPLFYSDANDPVKLKSPALKS